MIFEMVDSLEYLPNRGRREELVSDDQNEYLFIVEEDYKVIYKVEENKVKIFRVFDTRQHPNKLRL